VYFSPLPRADLWSVGVICYVCIAGYPPFEGATDADVMRSVKKGRFHFHAEPWDFMQKSLKHFIRKLMEVDPEKRMPVREALEHPWLKHKARGRVDALREETVDRLVNYSQYHVLRKAAMLAVAYHMPTDDLKILIELFRGLDLDGDGVLTRDEFIRAVRATGVEADLIKLMILSVDADHSGVIDFTEFLAATLEKSMYITKHDVILRAFRSFDQNDSGALTQQEIAETLEMTEPEKFKEIQRIYDEICCNEDGVIDYGEFYNMLSEEMQTLDQDKKEKARKEERAKREAEEAAASKDTSSPKAGKAVTFGAGEENAAAEATATATQGADGAADGDGAKSARTPIDPARARAMFMTKGIRKQTEELDDSEQPKDGNEEDADKEGDEEEGDEGFASGSLADTGEATEDLVAGKRKAVTMKA